MRILTLMVAGLGSSLMISSVQAANVAAPLGIELGITSCTQVNESKHSEWKLDEPRISAWSKGTILASSSPGIKGLERAGKLLVICDPEDHVIYLSLVIPKESVQNIASGLDKKYKSVQRNLPRLGGGYAKWSAANASIKIEYQHVSFDAYLTYETKKSEALYDLYSKEQARKKQSATESQL